MSILSQSQSERLDFRVTRDNKSLIEKAASIQGLTVTGFVKSVLVSAAGQVIQNETSRSLSARDSNTFFNMLSADAEPNASLKAAAKRYKERRDS